MFDFVKKLMFARQLKMEKGRIDMLGQRMMIIPTYTFACMIKNAKDPIETGKFIYDACKHTNRDALGFTYKVSEKFGLKGADLIRWMANIATMAGFGIIEVIEINENKKTAAVHITDSPMVQIIRNSKYSVDHPIRGYMAGAAEVIFNGLEKDNKKWKKYDYIETKCMAKGNNVCEFILGSRDDIINSSNEKIRELYKLQIGD